MRYFGAASKNSSHSLSFCKVDTKTEYPMEIFCFFFVIYTCKGSFIFKTTHFLSFLHLNSFTLTLVSSYLCLVTTVHSLKWLPPKTSDK